MTQVAEERKPKLDIIVYMTSARYSYMEHVQPATVHSHGITHPVWRASMWRCRALYDGPMGATENKKSSFIPSNSEYFKILFGH